MRIERSRNASRNIVYGVGFRIFQTVIPFIIRTVMIYSLGMEYVGLNSLFTSILHVLNLAEMGVGNAMVYSMYKPIAEDDNDKINRLLNLYKTYYRFIGIIILAGGLIIIPILPKLIKSDMPPGINLYIIYSLTLATTVLSYWLFSYRTSLLTAHQRNDIYFKIQIGVFSIQNLLQIFSLAVLKNYYIFLVAGLLGQAITNITILVVTNRMFANFKPLGQIPLEEKKEINHRIGDLFTAKLGGTVTNSADAVVISAFLGLAILAKYNNYFLVLTALFGFMTIIFQSCLAGIGNSLVVETPEKNYADFNMLSMILLWIIGLATAFLLCLYQPFMRLWVHKENMLSNSYVIVLCIYFYVYEAPLIWATYKDAGGIWHEDRFRPLVVTIVNLGLNLLTVQFWGLYGVLLSTVVSYLFVGMPWMLHNIFKCLFHRNPIQYIWRFLYISFVVVVGCFLSYWVCTFVDLHDLLEIIVKAVIVFFTANLTFFLGYLPIREFPNMKNYVFRVAKRIVHRKNNY